MHNITSKTCKDAYFANPLGQVWHPGTFDYFWRTTTVIWEAPILISNTTSQIVSKLGFRQWQNSEMTKQCWTAKWHHSLARRPPQLTRSQKITGSSWTRQVECGHFTDGFAQFCALTDMRKTKNLPPFFTSSFPFSSST